jgi:hypothetical protein
MSEHSRPYAVHGDEECERLELQARLANIEGHLRHLPVSPNDRVLDVGCVSGARAAGLGRSGTLHLSGRRGPVSIREWLVPASTD